MAQRLMAMPRLSQFAPSLLFIDFISKLKDVDAMKTNCGSTGWVTHMDGPKLLSNLIQSASSEGQNVCTDGEIEQTSLGKRWCQCQEGNNHPESNCEPTTLNEPDSSCHLQVQHSFVFPNTPPLLFPPSAVWLLWLSPILYSQCFSLSAVSLIYILSSDQRTRWNAPLLSPPFSLLYPCSPHQPSPLPLLLLLPHSCLILSLTSSWTSFRGS